MKRRVEQTYTLMHELIASPTQPMAPQLRRHQLTRMWGGLAAIERDAQPTLDDWRVCSDAVNLLETLATMGVVVDKNGLLPDAVSALAQAGARYKKGAPIRLSATGIQAVRAVLEDYAEALEALPARTMVQAHRRTEKRIQEILAGKRGSADVEVMDL